MNIVTREATTADVNAVYEFVCGLENEAFDMATFAAFFYGNLDKHHYHYLIAIEENRAIGFISCHGQVLLHHCGLVYEIQEMYVLPKYRSKGIGKMLLHALLDRIKDDNYVLLEVCSSFKRVDAHRFYEANGFVKTTYKLKRQP